MKKSYDAYSISSVMEVVCVKDNECNGMIPKITALCLKKNSKNHCKKSIDEAMNIVCGAHPTSRACDFVPTTTLPTTTRPTTTQNPLPTTKSSDINTMILIGCAIGGLLMLLLIAGLVVLLIIKKSGQQTVQPVVIGSGVGTPAKSVVSTANGAVSTSKKPMDV